MVFTLYFYSVLCVLSSVAVVGFVVTNAHVVEHSASNVMNITMWNGTKLTGRVHAMDTRADIALIKLDSNHRQLPVAKLGNSSELTPGEFVAALGSPMTLNNSVTFGIVSTVSRNGSELGMRSQGNDYIQTDVSINVGKQQITIHRTASQ
jgi:HtrA serine peptidase 2